jgi:hypothetical protein
VNADRPRRGSLASLQPIAGQPPPLPARPSVAPPGKSQTPEVGSPEVQTPDVRKPVRRPQPRRRPAAGPRAARVPEAQALEEAQASGLPKYLRLERKELLIWPDQITRLSLLARVLNRNRAAQGERITQNTLIRVAVALLLSRSQELAGTTEEELRRSLGLPD